MKSNFAIIQPLMAARNCLKNCRQMKLLVSKGKKDSNDQDDLLEVSMS